MNEGIPSVSHWGMGLKRALPTCPWKKSENWKMWVTHEGLSFCRRSSGRSMGMTMRFRMALGKRPHPFGDGIPG